MIVNQVLIFQQPECLVVDAGGRSCTQIQVSVAKIKSEDLACWFIDIGLRDLLARIMTDYFSGNR